MSRRRDKPLDVRKRLQVVRSVEELVYDEETGTYEKSKAMESDFFKATPVIKKKLNIPVTDIAQDVIFDDHVTPNFVLPQNYVRHTKIMNDEADVTTDYNIEDEDIAWLESNPKLLSDEELKATVTPTILESVFNLLERNTGYGDPINQQIAISLVCHHHQYSLPLGTKIVQLLYPYWLGKRSRLHKPLCRRFWPTTAVNDTNPHLVFRPREKERYRLRRHQKNDLQSFRKMQTLRREFTRARNLLELVLERELLKKADMDISAEIFEQHLRNISASAGGAGKELLVECKASTSGDSSESKTGVQSNVENTMETAALPSSNEDEKLSDSYRYKFHFPHLLPLLDPPKESDNSLYVDDNQNMKLTLKLKSGKSLKCDTDLQEKNSKKKKLKSEGAKNRKRDRTGTLLNADGARPSKSLSAKEKKSAKDPKAKKESKKDLKEKEKGSGNKKALSSQVSQPLGGRISVDATGRLVLHPNQHGNSKADSSGASDIILKDRLRRIKESMWPTFMDDLCTRQKVYAPRSVSEYRSELELLPGESPPSRFRLRGRIGRGGRIVMDRIPVYDHFHDPNTWRTQSHFAASRSSVHSISNHYDYIYPTSLHSVRQQEDIKSFAALFSSEKPTIYEPDIRHNMHSSEIALPDSENHDALLDDAVTSKPLCPTVDVMESNVINSQSCLIGNSSASLKGRASSSTDSETKELSSVRPDSESNPTFGSESDARSVMSSDPSAVESSSDIRSEQGNTAPSALNEQHPLSAESSEVLSEFRYSDDLSMCPLLFPPERDALFRLPSHREYDLFRLSDQRPKDTKVDPQLPCVLQANQLIPRDEESAESIISIPQKFKWFRLANDVSYVSSGGGSSSVNSNRSLNKPAGPTNADPKNSATNSVAEANNTHSSNTSDVTDLDAALEPCSKYTLYV